MQSKESGKERRWGVGRANVSFERTAEEFIFGLSNKILPNSVPILDCISCGHWVVPCLTNLEEVEAQVKGIMLQEVRTVRLLEAPWSWLSQRRLDGNKWPLTPVSSRHKSKSGIWPYTTGGSVSHSHVCIFSSLYPPPWFGLTHQHGRHRRAWWRDPSSRQDLLTSLGKCNQQTASSFLFRLCLCCRVSLPEVTPSLGQSAFGDWTWAGHLFQGDKVLHICLGSAPEVPSGLVYVTVWLLPLSVLPSCHRSWYLIEIYLIPKTPSQLLPLENPRCHNQLTISTLSYAHHVSSMFNELEKLSHSRMYSLSSTSHLWPPPASRDLRAREPGDRKLWNSCY